MAEPDRREDSIRARLQAARRMHRRLAGRIADLAGDIADTEDRLAEQLTRRAELVPERADELRARAQEAREYAEKERAEQPRWRRICDDPDQPGDPVR